MQRKKELADADGALLNPCEVHGPYFSLWYRLEILDASISKGIFPSSTANHNIPFRLLLKTQSFKIFTLSGSASSHLNVSCNQ